MHELEEYFTYMLGTKDKRMMFSNTVVKHLSYFFFEWLPLPYVVFFEMINCAKLLLNATIDSDPNRLFKRVGLSILRCNLGNFVKHLKCFGFLRSILILKTQPIELWRYNEFVETLLNSCASDKSSGTDFSLAYNEAGANRVCVVYYDANLKA